MSSSLIPHSLLLLLLWGAAGACAPPDVEEDAGPVLGPCECGPEEAIVQGECVAWATFDAENTMPGPCSDNEEPVCGCDGENYSNDCEARRAGAEVFHVGVCQL